MKLTPRKTKPSIDALLTGVESREPWKTADSLSGSTFERIVLEGERYVLKHLHVDDDWIQRAQGDLITRPVIMWRSGLFDALPASIDHTIVDIATGLGRNGWGAAVLMRDVSDAMVRVADGSIPIDQHHRFIEHMAELHAHFWGFEDTLGLMPRGNSYYMLGPLMSQLEAARGAPDPVPAMVPDGLTRMADESPRLADIVLPLLDQPARLVEAQGTGPMTLVHGDWKAGNLGSLGDGRTVLLDWAFPSEAPAPADIAWYIAVNCDLLPHSKEESIDAYRKALEHRGIETDDWWDRQLELALLAQVVFLGWSKTGAELAWWEDRVPRALRFLD